jgi:hypothetical protein
MTTKNTTTKKYAEHGSLYLCSFFDESLGGRRREKEHRHRKSTRTKMIRTKVSVYPFLVGILS